MRAGLFVGGASRRMGGAPKGLLPAPDTGEPLVVRLARIAREAGLEPCLVGAHPAYREALPGVPALADDPPGVGPAGGLRALLRPGGRAIALACDLPWLDAALLTRLAGEAPDAALLAAREPDGRWQPFFARWDAALLPALEAHLASGGRALQPLFAGAVELPLAADERRRLRDWDSPEDVRGTASSAARSPRR